MLPLLLIAVLATALRAAGRSGWRRVATWRDAALHAVAIVSVITGAAVFTRLGDDMVRMVPAWVPHPRAWVVSAGLIQIASGVALWFPAGRPMALGTLAALTMVKAPANLKAIHEGLWIHGPLPTPPWMRLPDMAIWVVLLVWLWRQSLVTASGRRR